jgi:hypothetical protein
VSLPTAREIKAYFQDGIYLAERDAVLFRADANLVD